ncbi:hypothetical protein [Streptomyces sp. MJM8645]|uniref:hypothetical protein n=1 Tax=Streptomyces sp. MJM8645 TaxID=1120523 RepID=UPI0007AF17AB|nr:hypothetical protein [Streptomyces sp. MJM8645]
MGDVVKQPALFAELPEPVRATIGDLMTHYIGLNRTDPTGPACGGPLLIHENGSTECRAGCPGELAVLHVPEALQFCTFADRFHDSLPEQSCSWCDHLTNPLHEQLVICPGLQTDHNDGTQECDLGTACQAPNGLHSLARTCGLFAPCARC